MALKCPICEKPVPARSANPSFPFCSPRCRAVDLGKWLGEEYRLPDKQTDERDDELPPMERDHGSEHDA